MKSYLKKTSMFNLGFNHFYFLMMTCSIIITPTFFRTTIFGRFFQADYFWIIGCLFLIIQAWMAGLIRRISTSRLLLFFLLNVSFFYSEGFTDNGNLIGRYLTIVLPTILLVFDFKYSKTLNSFSRSSIKLFNFVTYLVVVIGIIDKFSGMMISKIMAELFQIESFTNQVSVGRYVSWFGHPLTATTMFLFFLLINTVVLNDENKSNFERISYYIISGIGIILVQSKAGIFCFLLLTILTNWNKGNRKYIILLTAILVVSFAFGIFDSILERFMTGIYSGNLTTGRNRALTEVLYTGELNFDFFKGHASPFISRTMTIALEYPILRMAYLQGILFTVIWVIFIMIGPLKEFIKKKDFRLAFSLLAVLLQMNTYPSLAGIGDANAWLVTVIFIIKVLDTHKEAM